MRKLQREYTLKGHRYLDERNKLKKIILFSTKYYEGSQTIARKGPEKRELKKKVAKMLEENKTVKGTAKELYANRGLKKRKEK